MSDTMDGYPAYREPAARSPTERTSWSGREGREESYRANDRSDNARNDTFYRGRSPGTFMLKDSIFCLTSCAGVAWQPKSRPLFHRYRTDI